MTSAVFLDRDGVLTAPLRSADNTPLAPSHADAMEILPEAPAACQALRAAGLMLICITNQPEIARGNLAPAELDRMNQRLELELELDEVIVCPHDDSDACECRKPKPGMILRAAEEHGIELAASFTVGDRWRDIDAGNAAGTGTVFIDRRYDERLLSSPDLVVDGLKGAVEWIIRQTPRR